jgi:hypothetical protein
MSLEESISRHLLSGREAFKQDPQNTMILKQREAGWK